MSDIQKRTVSIYIDSTASEYALEKLQTKADGFNKKMEDARQKQVALRQEIEKLQPTANVVDSLKKSYDTLQKSIDASKKSLQENLQQQKNLSEQAATLSVRLESATIKQGVLVDAIKKNEEAGKSVAGLQRQYAAVEKEIELTTQKLSDNKTAMQSAVAEADTFKTSIAEGKEQLKQLSKEITASKNAAADIAVLDRQVKTLDSSIEAYGKDLVTVEQRQLKIKEQIEKGLGPSLVQQRTLVEQLRREWEQLPRGTQEYIDKTEELETAEANLRNMKGALDGVAKAQSNWLKDAGAVAFGVFIGNTVQSALASVQSYVSGIVNGNAKLSDSLADIQKSTGLSAESVATLNSQLSKLDTRTPTEQLRQIAIGLGQINEAATPENIAAIDKIVVALGDEFGGDANQITNTLSVLRNNLQDIKTGNYGEDVAHIGNALNVLGAEGLATAPVVTDISNRIAGVGETFGLTSGQILGTAATFQELGIETERGSTAFIKIMQKMSAEPSNFAKIAKAAGVATKEDFIKLLNTDMLEAFTKVAEGARLAGKDNTTFGKILKELDADGSGAGEVLSKLSKNEELLANKVQLATEALTNQSSITDEFQKKNTTFGAELDKLSKHLGSFITNSAVTSFFTGIVKDLNSLITPAKKAADAFQEQNTTVKDLERNITPLITRVDELQRKANELGGTTKLSKDEQVELNKAIVTIGNTIPGAITQFDQYGNAIAISTDKAKEFIRIQKNALQVKNAEQIRSTNVTISQLQKEIDYNNRWADDVLGNYKKTVGKQMFGHTVVDSPDNPIYATAKEIRDKNKPILEELQKQQDYLKTLTGEDLPTADDTKNTKQTTTKTTEISFDDTDKKADALLQKLKAFQFELQQIGKDADESEIARIRNKYEELTSEAAAYGVHLIGLEKDKNAAIAYLIDEETKKRKAASDKQFKENSTKEYDQALADSATYYEGLKKQQAESFVAKEIDQKQYEANVAAIDLAGKQQQLQIAQDYSVAVEKAASDVTKFKKQELTKEVADLIAANAKKLENEKLFKQLSNSAELSRAQTAINLSAPGTKERLAAEKNYLEVQKKQRLAAVDEEEREAITRGLQYTTEYNDKRDEINSEYSQKELQAERQNRADELQQYVEFASQAISILQQFNDIRSQNEQKALDLELKNNDKKKAALATQLKQRTITQQQYQIEVAKLDAEADQKKEALAKKQFERNKKYQIAQALMNGAAGAIRLWVDPGFPAAIPLAIALGAETLASVALIASQKYATGGRVEHPGNGKITTSSNIPTQPNGDDVLATVKRGEVILNEEQQRRAGGADFFRRIGVPGFASGGLVPSYKTRAYKPIDYAGATRSLQTVKHYANGGVVTGNAQSTTTTTDPALLELVKQSQETNEQLMQTNMMLMNTVNGLTLQLSKGIKAEVPLKKIEDATAQRDRILSEGTFQ